MQLNQFDMFTNNSGCKKPLNVIEPNKCIIEDLEILAFESEEQLNYYTIWHEALQDKRRELNAGSERERQIIRNEIARKTRQLIGSAGGGDLKRPTSESISKSSKSSSSRSSSSRRPAPIAPSPQRASATTALAASRRAVAAAVAFRPSRSSNQSLAAQSAASHQRQGSASLPNGLTILNSSHFNTLPSGKQMMRYKLTKLYNKYRGRQVRRNFVNEKQRNARIEVEIAKSYLNSWLAYTALQALRLPETNINSLNTTTNNSSTILTPMAQPMPIAKKSKCSSNKKQPLKPPTGPQAPQKPPMHLVYIDPGNIITYSNRINPQQVAEYRRKSHLLPSSATSKKSSAASYDVYEIMEVLANTNKTNVTITRNANRPSQTGAPSASIYSHSVNANTPGIVSTQLHLQARAYLDSMNKFYIEESERLAKEQEEMKKEPPAEELINRYLNHDQSNGFKFGTSSYSKNSRHVTPLDKDRAGDHEEDELEMLEQDILSMLNQSKDRDSSNLVLVPDAVT